MNFLIPSPNGEVVFSVFGAIWVKRRQEEAERGEERGDGEEDDDDDGVDDKAEEKEERDFV